MAVSGWRIVVLKRSPLNNGAVCTARRFLFISFVQRYTIITLVVGKQNAALKIYNLRDANSSKSRFKVVPYTLQLITLYLRFTCTK